jgi:hypothetical protein
VDYNYVVANVSEDSVDSYWTRGGLQLTNFVSPIDHHRHRNVFSS